MIIILDLKYDSLIWYEKKKKKRFNCIWKCKLNAGLKLSDNIGFIAIHREIALSCTMIVFHPSNFVRELLPFLEFNIGCLVADTEIWIQSFLSWQLLLPVVHEFWHDIMELDSSSEIITNTKMYKYWQNSIQKFYLFIKVFQLFTKIYVKIFWFL